MRRIHAGTGDRLNSSCYTLDMDKMQAVSAVLGALYTIATALHVFFPKVALFQRFGAAVRQLGPKS